MSTFKSGVLESGSSIIFSHRKDAEEALELFQKSTLLKEYHPRVQNIGTTYHYVSFDDILNEEAISEVLGLGIGDGRGIQNVENEANYRANTKQL